MHLELVLVGVLIPCAPVFGVLSFFFFEFQEFSSERDMVEVLQGSCSADHLFLPLSEGAGIPAF
jgi:hypothetical protein